MSDNPNFDKVNNDYQTPIYDNVANPEVEEVEKTPWQKRIAILKNPSFRKWAYGVTAAALTLVLTGTGNAAWIPLVSPLILAIFYVDPKGEAK